MARYPRREDERDTDLWWKAKKGRVHEQLLPYVEKVERVQSALFDRFVKLVAFYDPYQPGASAASDPRERVVDPSGLMQENLIASNCDAIAGTIAATEIGVRFPSDGGDWSKQRLYRQCDWYAEGLDKLLDLEARKRDAFHAGSLKGTAGAWVEIDPFDDIKVEHVEPDEIVVEDALTRHGWTPHLQRRQMLTRDELVAMYPQHEAKIRAAQTGGGRKWKKWAGYRPIYDQQIVVITGIRLPIGKPGHPRYVPGRKVRCIDGLDLSDEPYNKPHYPLAVFRWTKRPNSWYGIGGAERIIGHQRKVNRRNMQMDRQHDMMAFPTTWVRLPDANISVRATRAGAIGVYKADLPKTEIPPSISPETYRDKQDTRQLGFEEFGQSRMQATAMKPAGLDSGVALREHKDQTSERFAGQEKDLERFKLDIVFLSLDCAKDLGAKAPVIIRDSLFGERKVPWPKVDMVELRRVMQVSSTLGRTPAGRRQLAMELAQAGLVSKDTAIRWAMPNATPDIEAELSRYAEAVEDAEATIEEVANGAYMTPEPYQNLDVLIWRAQMAYLRWKRIKKCPEDRLAALRDLIVMAEHELAMAAQPAPGAMADPNAMPTAGGPPGGEQPVAALSPQAMQLRAV